MDSENIKSKLIASSGSAELWMQARKLIEKIHLMPWNMNIIGPNVQKRIGSFSEIKIQ